jgi:membrane fusion protein, multidrug efflux system
VVETEAMKYILFLAAILACSRQPVSRPAATGIETGSLAAAPGRLATADTATVEVPLTLPSQLYVERDATVYARSGGIVESILVDLGSQVAPGQLLARLESTDQEIALAQAREKFTNTRQMVERQRALTVAGVMTQADSERVEFEHREAVLALRKAQRDYDMTRITAPFAGVVTARTARLHRLVNLGDSLFRITALRPILAAVRVPESSAAAIGIGTQAEIIGPNGTRADAKVIRASPVLDAGSGTREMILQLSGSGPRLTPGSNVSVRLGLERRQVVAIPRTAVAQDGYALVWADEKTTLRPVTLGDQIGEDLVEVVSGLTLGEKVLRTAP